MGIALTMLAACVPAPRPAVRADLVLDVSARPEDPSLVAAQYRAWDADGQRIPNIELDHGHGPTDVDDDDETVVRAHWDGQALPLQAIDTDGDHVIVDLDALPMGRQTLRLAVVHDGLVSDELAIQVLDRRLATP